MKDFLTDVNNKYKDLISKSRDKMGKENGIKFDKIITISLGVLVILIIPILFTIITSFLGSGAVTMAAWVSVQAVFYTLTGILLVLKMWSSGFKNM